MRRIQLPLTKDVIQSLRAGDNVLLSGTALTARDAAHKRLIQCLDEGKTMPVQIAGQTIYYVGPAPASPGRAVGSAGPTTSYRMDAYTPRLLEEGLLGMIGTGMRSDDVKRAIIERGAVYFGATGGAAALLAERIVASRVICYEDLGAEAIHEFQFRDFPVVVLMDCYGGDLYNSGVRDYLQTVKP